MSLDVFQQVFSLSFLSNAVRDIKGTQAALQERLQTEVDLALPRIGAGWQPVWGPVVWKNKPDEANTGADNSWYIVFNPSLEFEDGSVCPAYVIVVAGTPLASQYAWFKENFAVNSVSSFNAWVAGGIQNKPVVVPPRDVVPGTPYIATGTVNAIHLLLTTPAPQGAASAGVTLFDFIATPASLGGTLSPSLALALVSSGVIPADGTLTYPSAGASPGNPAFTDLFIQTLPPRKTPGARSYQGWNLNLVNTLDIVPQAWCPFKQLSPEQNLTNIPPIYGLPMLPLVAGATIVFGVHAVSSGIFYKPLPSQYFTGLPPHSAPKNLLEFLSILGPQHIKYYLEEVGVEDPTSPLPLGAGLSEKTAGEKRLNYPVIAEFEWEYEHPGEAKKIIDEVENGPEAQQLSSQ